MKQDDRPLIVQFCSEDPDTLVEAVNGLEDLCDAVDISSNYNSSSSNVLPVDDQHDKWNSWLDCIQRVHQECKTPVVCKLPFNQQAIDDTIRKGRSLQEVGCELLLLHKQRPEKINYIITKEDWDSVKVIRESVSLPLILDVGSSSLWDIDKCIEYTGVHGVAVSESLKHNPAVFCKKQPPVVDVVNQYLELCERHPTSIANIKQHLIGFCGFYLSRFHNRRATIEEAENLEDIRLLVGELSKEMSLLSGKEMKSLVRLKQKKELFKQNREKKREEKESTKESEIVKDENHIPKILLKKIRKERVENAMKNGGQRVAIDFTVSDDMCNKEVTKLAAQVRQLYGSNLRSVLPVHLHLTGLETGGKVYRECVRQSLHFSKLMASLSEESYLTLFNADDVVYLTPDSPNELDKLNKDKVYIIGGLVDHALRKDKTRSRADAKGVSTARLPIYKYMERTREPGNRSFSSVLAVNQVFDILLKLHETHDWRCALETSVPSRKGLVLKQP
ncbi:tRNA (guanine(9)-N(1))-methyltransferase [Desmophyllum pertusum]|uniref:tRNA (Guanine(9)-N(1))-methyltransferase n=1 Tax=Desmophyllum pertusum TaxID=174260 RepID=A0A9W9ZC28_9CNID|nr:tRNA (guanine(9)-N(1))-methyltransferase [Desmophyllum pertusum]